MAVRIFEMARVQIAGGTGLQLCPNVPWAVTQSPLTATGTSQQSAAFGSTTNAITVQADEAVHIEIAANPTATVNSYKLAAGAQADFWVTPGHKLAVRTA